MATTNYNLPTYKTGDVAGYLTMTGWNDAMEAIDTAIASEKSGTKKTESKTYAAQIASGGTQAIIETIYPQDAITGVNVFLANSGTLVQSIEVGAGETESTKITVTIEGVAPEDVGVNITVTMEAR